jgi:hypothetical protein
MIRQALAPGLALALFAGTAGAQTLVYCSEGSPEGFDPGLYTAGTTFDASSHTIYNQLVEFVTGTTEVVPGLAESFEASEDGLTYTFHLRPSFSALLRNSVGTVFCDAPKKKGTRTPTGMAPRSILPTFSKSTSNTVSAMASPPIAGKR